MKSGKKLYFLHLASLKAKINFSSASNNKPLCQYLFEQLSFARWDLAATPVFIPCHSHSGEGGSGSYAATYLHTKTYENQSDFKVPLSEGLFFLSHMEKSDWQLCDFTLQITHIPYVEALGFGGDLAAGRR